MIEPIVVRPKEDRYKPIAGERRFRALRDYTSIKTIQAQIVKASDLQARRISAAENLQREDLSAIETIEAVVEIVDAELIEDKEYASMAKNPADRVKTLLGKLDSISISKKRGSKASKKADLLFNKFIKQVEKNFKNLPKHLEWLSFLNNDLPLLVDICKEVQEVSIQLRPWPIGLLEPGLALAGLYTWRAEQIPDPECKWTEAALVQKLGVIEQTVNSWISDI